MPGSELNGRTLKGVNHPCPSTKLASILDKIIPSCNALARTKCDCFTYEAPVLWAALFNPLRQVYLGVQTVPPRPSTNVTRLPSFQLHGMSRFFCDTLYIRYSDRSSFNFVDQESHSTVVHTYSNSIERTRYYSSTNVLLGM